MICMSKSTLPMTNINKAIARLEGPYDYQETRKVVDNLSDQTQKKLHHTEVAADFFKEKVSYKSGKKEKAIS